MTIEQIFLQIQAKVQSLTNTLNDLQSKSSNFSVFLGATGSGKSTLTNYIHDVQLTFKKNGPIYTIQHQNKDNLQLVPEIGNLKQSCTKIPNICTKNGSTSADLIGWFDTQNPSQEIINSFSNSKVLIKGKKLKIVIVCQISSLVAQRGGAFVQIVKLLYQVFKNDLQNIQNSTMIVFSKVDTSDWQLQDIHNQVNKIISLNQNLDEPTKKLLKIVIDKKRVAIFPTPDKIKDQIQKIKNMIQTIDETTLMYNSQISLSPQAMDLKNKFQQILSQNTKAIVSQYSQIMRQKFINTSYSHSSSLNSPISTLKTIQTYASIMINSNEASQLSAFTNFNANISAPNNNFLKAVAHIKMIQFCKKLNKHFRQFQNFSQLILKPIAQFIANLESQKSRLTSQQQKKILQEQQRQEKIRREAQNLRQKQLLQAREREYQQQLKKQALQKEALALKQKRQLQAKQREHQEKLKKLREQQQQMQKQRQKQRKIHQKSMEILKIQGQIAQTQAKINEIRCTKRGFWGLLYTAILEQYQAELSSLKYRKSILVAQKSNMQCEIM